MATESGTGNLMKDAVIQATKEVINDTLKEPLNQPKAQSVPFEQNEETKSNTKLKKIKSAPDLMTMGRQLTVIKGLIEGTVPIYTSKL